MRPTDILFLIPARAGSRRFPGKNKAILEGHPLWELAVLQATQACELLGANQGSVHAQVCVSTDDPEIDLKLQWTFFNRLQRPDHLADDRATSESVALHALEYYPADMVCLLQPTSPLRRRLDIVRCIMMCPAYTTAGGQYANGAVYTCFAEDLRSGFKFTAPYCQHVLMPKERSIDIDLPEDLAHAEEYLCRNMTVSKPRRIEVG